VNLVRHAGVVLTLTAHSLREALDGLAASLRRFRERPHVVGVDLAAGDEHTALTRWRFDAFATHAFALTHAPLSANTAQSYLDALHEEIKFLDWTLPPRGAVTAESVDAVATRCARLAARAYQLAAEVAERPRAAGAQNEEPRAVHAPLLSDTDANTDTAEENHRVA